MINLKVYYVICECSSFAIFEGHVMHLEKSCSYEVSIQQKSKKSDFRGPLKGVKGLEYP
jgi:hypothetical protein